MFEKKGKQGLVYGFKMEAYPDKRYRNVRVWLPEEYDGIKKFPVIYMHDGQNLFDDKEPRAKWYVDKEMQYMKKDGISAIIVGIDNAETRMSELCPDILPINDECYKICKLPPEKVIPTGNLYAEFITFQLKPWIDDNFLTFPDKENTIIGGSSMGGLMSFYMLLKYPEIYGSALVFSPNFVMYEKPAFMELLSGLDYEKFCNNKIFIFHGGIGLEDDNWPYVREVFEIMRDKGMDENHLALIYDSRQPHYETAWRKYFREAVVFLRGK